MTINVNHFLHVPQPWPWLWEVPARSTVALLPLHRPQTNSSISRKNSATISRLRRSSNNVCGTVKPPVWMSEVIAMCVEGSSCSTWRAEWCEQEVTGVFFPPLAVCRAFVQRPPTPGLSNLSGTLFHGIIKDCLSGLPQLSWWSLARGWPQLRVTVQIIRFFSWRAKSKNRNCLLILSKRRWRIWGSLGACFKDFIYVFFFIVCSELICRGESPVQAKDRPAGRPLFPHVKLDPRSSCSFAFFPMSNPWGGRVVVLAAFQSFLWAQVKRILTIPSLGVL